MKTINEGNGPSVKSIARSARAFVIAGFLFAALPATLRAAGPGLPLYSYWPMVSWSFSDTTNWTSDYGYAPVSFTNITGQWFGNGTSLGLNTNIPAWLQYNVMESDGTTNLTVDQGSVVFWFAPAWAGTNQGGAGPGQWGRLIETGAYTTNASYGWWGLYVDDVGDNLYFSVQPGDGSTTTFLAAPIAWTTNYWHSIALTYCATNTALYLDGVLATNGPGIASWPGTNVLAGGFYIGSDSNGMNQAQGAFDDLSTYNVPLDSDTVYGLFNEFWPDYFLSPFNNMRVSGIASGPSSPSYGSTFDVITGQGNLQLVGGASTCINGADAYDVWITNVVATVSGSGSNNMSLMFTIEGGQDGYYYDVFANSVLSFGIDGVPWAWMGQGQRCNIYTLTNLPSTTCFLILGTPLDTQGYGLTDAYELLVAKVNPGDSQTDTNGVPYAWYAENGLIPITAGIGGLDPDSDGLLNYQEYFYGTRPLVSEGSTIWVSTPGGLSSIP